MSRGRGLAAAALVLSWAWVAGGCDQARPFGDLWVEPRPYHAERPVARPSRGAAMDPAGASESVTVAEPTGTITLGEAVGLALRHSPALAASGWEVAAAEMDARQMGRPPNPRVSVSARNFAGPESGDTFKRQSLRISQVIELAGKRRKRLAVGRAEQRLRAWEYEGRRIDLAAQTASRYVAVVVAQRRVAVAEDQLALAEAGLEIADDRARQGEAPGLDRDQAEARVALGRIAVEQARQSLAAARADLAATWGAERPTFKSAAGQLEAEIDLPALQTLEARVDQSPRIARWDAEIARRRRAFELEQANGVADPTLGGGVRYFPDAGDVAGVVELSWPLTLLDDNRHAARAARLRVSRAHAQRHEARTEAHRSLARAHARAAASIFALEAIDGQALPAARAAHQASLEAYEAGVTDYLTVLDAERTLLEIRHRRLDAMLESHQAVIEIERLTAQAIDA